MPPDPVEQELKVVKRVLRKTLQCLREQADGTRRPPKDLGEFDRLIADLKDKDT